MTKEEYIEGKKKAGHELHLHDDVWWETTRKGYCKPALLYEPLAYGSARPALSKSYVGYNHRVTDEKDSTGYWQPLVMREKGISNWSLENVESGNRRRRIRKGLKNNVVKRIDDIENYRESFARILKSTAIRNGHGHPPEYYDLNKTDWWKTIEQVKHYTEFWCAFEGDQMSAYICLHVIGNRVIVDGVKSDTDLLPGCPIDAILHDMLTDLRDRGGITEMWYGGKSNRPTLDKFKISYGFEVEQIPYVIRFLGGLIKYPKFIGRNVEEA